MGRHLERRQGNLNGAFVVQDVDDFGTQLWGGYCCYDLDRADLGLVYLHLWTAGMSVLFDAELTFFDE